MIGNFSLIKVLKITVPIYRLIFTIYMIAGYI